jgi:hypothetical protein
MPAFNQKKLVTCVLTGHVAISMGPLDVCKTPAPPAPAPVPLPYPNMAPSVLMGSGWTTKTMTVLGFLWTKKGKSASSLPPHPGVLMNIETNKYMGMCSITMASSDVKAEGGEISRSADQGSSNE